MPDKLDLTIERQGLLARFIVKGECVAEVDGACNDGWTIRTLHPELDKWNFAIQPVLELALGKIMRVIIIVFTEEV